MKSKPMHKLLLRQLKRSKMSIEAQEQAMNFLNLVNQTYEETDQYLERMDHAMEVSSRETQVLYKKLEVMNESLSEQVKESATEIDYQKSVFNSVSRSIPVGVFIVNKHSEYVYVNDSALRIVEEERDFLLGKNWVEYCKSKGIEVQNSSSLEATLSLIHPRILKLTHIPGKTIQLSCLKIPGGGIVGCVEDVTEMELFRSKTKEAMAKSEEANKAKSFFLANMSHEIRTPLNGILGLSTLLKDEKLNEDQMLKVKSIEESGKHLMHLINDILDLSKIEAGALELNMSAYSPKEIINKTISLLEGKAQERGNKISVHYVGDIPGFVRTDDLRFKQIALNLIGNAIKFTSGGEITVIVSYKEDRVRLKITDNGIGMSEAQTDKLFTRFYQADNASTRNFEGTGLGLAITKNLVELLEGEISCVSVFGQGSVFDVSFKADSVSTVSHDSDTHVKSEVNLGEELPLMILVAEDNKVNQMVIRAFLNKAGYNPKIVNDGKEAVDELEANEYDLVFMDIQMPRMSGIDAIKYIRESDKLKELKVFALTAGAMEQEKERILEAGANEYLTKPIEPEKINQAIRDHFKTNRA